MTKEELLEANIYLDDYDSKTLLFFEAGLEWLENNTSVTVDRSNLGALPACAKAFLVQFVPIASRSENIASESIDGLSRSYNSGDKKTLILDLASSLLGKYLVGQVRFISAKKRWE